jgi:hypothetical protein
MKDNWNKNIVLTFKNLADVCRQPSKYAGTLRTFVGNGSNCAGTLRTFVGNGSNCAGTLRTFVGNGSKSAGTLRTFVGSLFQFKMPFRQPLERVRILIGN